MLFTQFTATRTSPLFHVLIATILFSTLPIAFAAGDAASAPLLFVGIVKLMEVVVCVIVMFLIKPQLLTTERHLLKTIRKNIIHPAIFWASVSNLDYVFFALALKYLNISVATVLAETWPIITILAMGRMCNLHQRYAEITPTQWVFVGLGFGGCALVIMSGSNTTENLIQDLLAYDTIIGIILAVLSSYLAAINAPYNISWGLLTAKGKPKDELFFTVVGLAIGTLITGTLFLLGSTLSAETLPNNSRTTVIAISYGLACSTAAVLLRMGQLKTTNLGINAICYIVPALALLWLWLADMLTIPHTDWLLIGLATIITANITVNHNQKPVNDTR